MANTYIYDIDTGTFVSPQGLAVATVPAIHYGTKPVWNILLRHGDGSIPALEDVIYFRAAVDTDFNASTDPLCRTSTGITYNAATGLLSVPLDAKTVNFRNKCNGRQTTAAFFEVHGYDASENELFYILFRVSCNFVIDPDGTGAVDPDTGDPMTEEEVAAIAYQVYQGQTELVESTATALTVQPGQAIIWTPSANGTISASGGVAGQRAYAVVDIVLDGSTNVTLSGISWASTSDELRLSTTNHCVLIFNGTDVSLAVCDLHDGDGGSGGGGGDLTDYYTSAQVDALLVGKMSAPSSPGTVGQVLTRNANGYGWDTPQGGGGGGTNESAVKEIALIYS